MSENHEDLKDLKSPSYGLLKRLAIYYLAASVFIDNTKGGNHPDFIKLLNSHRDKMTNWIMDVYQELGTTLPNANLEGMFVRYFPKETAPLRIDMQFDNGDNVILSLSVNEYEIQRAVEIFVSEENIPESLKQAHAQWTAEEIKSRLATTAWPVYP